MSIQDLRGKIETMKTSDQWWKPTEVGDTIVGKIKSMKYLDGKYGKNLVIELEDENGEITMVGCKTVIERELKSKKAKPGDLLALKYMGKVKNYQSYVVLLEPGKEETEEAPKWAVD